jgi:hypothetical protein
VINCRKASAWLLLPLLLLLLLLLVVLAVWGCLAAAAAAAGAGAVASPVFWRGSLEMHQMRAYLM